MWRNVSGWRCNILENNLANVHGRTIVRSFFYLQSIMTAEAMMLKNKIAFIGPGVMAEAMIAGLLRQKLAKPENLIAS